MSESQFAFLEAEFADEFAMAEWAERHALSDPGPAVIYARKALESGVKWVYRYDRSLPEPYEDQLNAYLNEPAFKALANGHVFNVAKKIQRAGNRAVHESKPPTKLEAVEVISALFQFCFWLAFTYGREVKPDPSIKFNPQKLTADRLAAEKASLAERQELEERLEREAEEAELARQRAAELVADGRAVGGRTGCVDRRGRCGEEGRRRRSRSRRTTGRSSRPASTRSTRCSPRRVGG